MESYDVIVIGSGPGGYVAAIRCAQLGLKTACIEKDPTLGGTCLNVGCIPSKALLHSSELFAKLDHHYPEHGIAVENARFDFTKMMARKSQVVKTFNGGIAALFKKNKITHIPGLATFKTPNILTVGDKEVEGKSIIIATGSDPINLSFLPVDEKRVVTNTGALALEQVPKKLIVIGAGVIGVELGSVYKRLGAEVTFLEFLEKICPTMDADVSKSFQQILEKQGLTFHLKTKVTGAEIKPSEIVLTVEGGETHTADVVLCSIGRRPYTQGLGLEVVGLTLSERGFIPINARFQTALPHIYAIGDVVDGPMLAHKASEEGVAIAEIIAGLSPHIDYLAIPSVIYTDPEVAAVGLTEQEAKAMGLEIKSGKFPFAVNSRAQCTGENLGFVKIVTLKETGRIIGVHIVGAHASELIAEGVIAVEKKMTALEVANAPHAHPTLSEAVKEAALTVLGRALHR